MTTKLIQLDDGMLIEVEASPDEVRPISFDFADKVNNSLKKIEPILVETCKPIIAAWEAINQEMNIEQAKIQLGLSFEGEGNIYVTKVKSGANLIIELTLKPNR